MSTFVLLLPKLPQVVITGAYQKMLKVFGILNFTITREYMTEVKYFANIVKPKLPFHVHHLITDV